MDLRNLQLPDHKEFLEELTKLSHKYNIAIGGCGCCGSPTLFEPFLTKEEREKSDSKYTVDPWMDNLSFDDKTTRIQNKREV